MEAANNSAWRNHYLPQSYLSHFCDSSGQVLRTFRGPDDRLHEKRFPTRSTGYEPDLYSLSDEGLASGDRDKDVFEREVFGPIDNDGIKAFRRIIATAPSDLSDEERGHLALMLNSFVERHPQRLRERDEKAIEMGREIMLALKQAWGLPPEGRPDVLDLINSDGLVKNLHRKHMIDQIQDEKTVDYLKRLTFLKVTIEESPMLSFVTGDNPLLINLGKPWPLEWFTLALDPRTLLLGHAFSEPLDDVDIFMSLSIAHNIQMFQQCEYVYSKDHLKDNPFIKTRLAALTLLKPVPWTKAR